jgi:hypothetical protein
MYGLFSIKHNDICVSLVRPVWFISQLRRHISAYNSAIIRSQYSYARLQPAVFIRYEISFRLQLFAKTSY